MLSRLFIVALWSPEGKGLISRLLFVLFFCDFVTFPFSILGQVCNLIVSIPDPCCFSYFNMIMPLLNKNDATCLSTCGCSKQLICTRMDKNKILD